MDSGADTSPGDRPFHLDVLDKTDDRSGGIALEALAEVHPLVLGAGHLALALGHVEPRVAVEVGHRHSQRPAAGGRVEDRRRHR